MFKQVLVVRTDLRMSKGKLATQVAHAAVEAVLKSGAKKTEKWRKEGAKKVVVKVNSASKLRALQRAASKARLTNALISDAGLTELKPGTKTALGIGPDEEKKIDKITGKLKLL